MNGKLKRIFTLITAMTFVFTTMMTTSMTAFAANENNYIWAEGWEGEHGTFSVDTKNYNGSRYSIKMTNEDYYSSYLTKIVDVEPLTTYKFSAMVKYSDYKLSSNAEMEKTGAALSAKIPGTATYNGSSSRYNGKKWKKLELEFTTMEDQTEVELMLWNGDQNALCKGTARFSDIKLEKAVTTNEWNVLTLIYKNVDAKVKLNDKTVTVDRSLSKTDIKKIKKEIKNYRNWVNNNSNGLITINDMDIISINAPVTELVPFNINDDPNAPGYSGGYRLDDHADYIEKYVNKYSKEKKYHQIFVVVPLSGVTMCWSGATGMYNNTTGFSQILYDAESFNADDFMSHFIHEWLHVICIHSLKLDPNTPDVHAYLNDEKTYNTAELNEWYAKYMTSELRGGKGANPKSFLVASEYTVVDDDMSAGGIVDTSALPLMLSDVTKHKVKNQAYTGKAIKPDIKLTDGDYTLKNGVDYTVSYKNNTKIGTAKATITGKGAYTGTRTLTFKIVPAKTQLKVNKQSNEKVKLTWNKIANADKYQIYYSVNGGEYEKLATVSSSKTSYTNSKLDFKKNDYKFKIRACDNVDETTYYGSFSNAVTVK